jgi:hypothetical protein
VTSWRIPVCGLLSAAFLTFEGPLMACVMAPPLVQRQDESDEAFAARKKVEEADANKTPEQRELELQAQLWENSDIVFVGRFEKIKVKGKAYPSPKSPNRLAAKRGAPPMLEPPEPPILIPFFEGGEAFIKSVYRLKGNILFEPRWHYVGGITSCGNAMDGSLGTSFIGENVIIFASWEEQYQWVDGKEIKSKYLDLYGLKPDQVFELRLQVALANLSKP